MGAFIVWTPEGSPLETSMGFDAVLSEMHDKRGEATMHPVEKGSDISDHVIPDPKRVTLEVYVTNQPITDKDLFGNIVGQFGVSVPLELREYEAPFAPTPGAVFSAIGGAVRSLLGKKREYAAWVLKFIREQNYIAIARETFDKLVDERTLVKLVTKSGTYEDMVLVSAPMTKRPDLGDAATFSLEFVKMRIVESANSVLPKEIKAVPKVTKGQKSPKEPPEQTSLLYDLKHRGWGN